jgi:hypothetical protein
LWFGAFVAAALPRHLHAHPIGTALVIAAAAGTMLWFAWRGCSSLCLLGLTNWLSARRGGSGL